MTTLTDLNLELFPISVNSCEAINLKPTETFYDTSSMYSGHQVVMSGTKKSTLTLFWVIPHS